MSKLLPLLIAAAVIVGLIMLVLRGMKRKQDGDAGEPQSAVQARTSDMDTPAPSATSSRDADAGEVPGARAEHAPAEAPGGAPYTIDATLFATALAGGSVQQQGQAVTFTVRDIGLLEITSGQVAASDPLVQPDPPGYTQAVPNGRHPVRVLIALFGDDERIAYAQLRFSDTPVVRWEMAYVSGQDMATLKADEFFGYGVDAGTGCFMDPRTGKLLEARMGAQDDYFEEIIDGMEATYVHTRSWLDFRPDEGSSANVICFSSGYGDGSYPSFFGLDAQGNVAMLVTDFMIVGGQ